MRKLYLKLLLGLSLLFFVFYNVKGDVYLLTGHGDTFDHSMLVVTETVIQNGIKKEVLKAVLNKYPGPDSRIIIENNIIKQPATSGFYDIGKQQGIGGYTGIKLSVESNSELEHKIIEQIKIYEKKFWITNNCGQGTFGVLRDAGYFDTSTLNSVEQLYGSYNQFVESALITSGAVWLQENANAVKIRKEQEEKELQAQQDVIENDENGDITPDGDEVVNDTGDTNQPDGDEVVVNNDSENNNADTSDEYDSGISLVDVANDVADHFAIVLPNIPHYRLLWIFSGESLGSSVKSLWDGFSNKSGNGNVSELKSNLKLIKDIGND